MHLLIWQSGSIRYSLRFEPIKIISPSIKQIIFCRISVKIKLGNVFEIIAKGMPLDDISMEIYYTWTAHSNFYLI